MYFSEFCDVCNTGQLLKFSICCNSFYPPDWTFTFMLNFVFIILHFFSSEQWELSKHQASQTWICLYLWNWRASLGPCRLLPSTTRPPPTTRTHQKVPSTSTERALRCLIFTQKLWARHILYSYTERINGRAGIWSRITRFWHPSTTRDCLSTLVTSIAFIKSFQLTVLETYRHYHWILITTGTIAALDLRKRKLRLVWDHISHHQKAWESLGELFTLPRMFHVCFASYLSRCLLLHLRWKHLSSSRLHLAHFCCILKLRSSISSSRKASSSLPSHSPRLR